jgi:ABC-type sugar transport system substrate-binding protein
MSRKKRRKAMIFLTVSVLALSFPGCGKKENTSDRTLRVGIVTYTQDDPFINTMTEQIREDLKLKESKDMKILVSVKNGDNDQRDQDELVEMIAAGCDVLCVNLVDRTAPSDIIKAARQEKIPVIFFNREPVKEDLMQWDQLYYVGCDAKQSGEMQGEIAADYLKAHPGADKNQDGKIQYVLLEGEAGHQDAISRTDCSVKTLIENGIELEKLSYQFADWNRGQAENRMSQLIDHYGTEIELVISNNDEMALGAVEAYKNAGYSQEQRPVIFGIDGLEDALEAVKEGTMQGTVYNDNVDQAGEIARLAVDLFKGNDISKHKLKDGRYYMSLYQKVETGNVDEFLEK